MGVGLGNISCVLHFGSLCYIFSAIRKNQFNYSSSCTYYVQYILMLVIYNLFYPTPGIRNVALSIADHTHFTQLYIYVNYNVFIITFYLNFFQITYVCTNI